MHPFQYIAPYLGVRRYLHPLYRSFTLMVFNADPKLWSFSSSGSRGYQSPELMRNCGVPDDQRQSRVDGGKADAWAIGCLLHALLLGYLPFMAPRGTPEDQKELVSLRLIEDWVRHKSYYFFTQQDSL